MKKLNKTEICKDLGISRKTLYDWRDAGCDIDDLEAIKKWSIDTRCSGDVDDEDIDQAKRRKVIADSEKAVWDAKIKELKAAKDEGELINIHEVKETLTGIATRMKGRFLSLSGELPPKLAGLEAEEMSELIEKEISNVLTELSTEFKKLQN